MYQKNKTSNVICNIIYRNVKCHKTYTNSNRNTNANQICNISTQKQRQKKKKSVSFCSKYIMSFVDLFVFHNIVVLALITHDGTEYLFLSIIPHYHRYLDHYITIIFTLCPIVILVFVQYQ